jgi:hypothetical protein
VYLFREPEKATLEQDQDEVVQDELDEETGRQKLYSRTMNDGCYCLGSAEAVNKFLATSRYAQLMPSIPEEELYASSIQHPSHPDMIWLLHTRRVPCLSTVDSHVALDPRCAGIGDINETVWCCKDCINALCRPNAKQIAMPPPALANLLWLGREHPLAQTASLGTRLLSCLGRPVWRKLILGRGDKDDLQQGINGNSILLAQARPGHLAASLPTPTEGLQDTFVVLFSRSIEEVKKAKMLVVHRQDFIDLVRTRQRVCTAYADVPLDEKRAEQLPDNDVPSEIIACAQHLPEAENVDITKVGPASRPVDMACDAHGAEEHNHDDEWEEMDDDPTCITEAERQHQTFDTNTSEDVIAVDHSDQPNVLETFAAFQTKLRAMHDAASRVITSKQRQAETENKASAPGDDASVFAAGTVVADKEECHTVVLEMQQLAKKLSKVDLKKMAESYARDATACVSTSGKPLSMWNPDTWPKCFLEFFYGDAVPDMKERGQKGNGTVYVKMEDIFSWLQDFFVVILEIRTFNFSSELRLRKQHAFNVSFFFLSAQ